MNTNQINPVPTTQTSAPRAATDATEALPYHRLALATPRHRWWRPLITLVLTLVFWFAFQFGWGLAVGSLAGSSPDLRAATEEIPGVPTPNRPLGAAFLFGNIALLLPALALALLIGERRTIGTMSSVAGRLRRGLLGRYLGLAAAIVAVTTTASAALTLATGTPMTPQVTPWTLGLLAVTFLLIPLQATAEEYVFRGLPQQMLGSWLKSPWWGILVPIPLFAFAHLYNALGLISTALFALAAGILTWRTGGLEAAIGLHVVNNLVAIGMGAFAITDLAATEVTPASLITSTIATVSYTALVLRGRKTPARGTT